MSNLTKFDKTQGEDMRHYYLRRRSKGGKWYAIIMNTVTKKPDFSRCTGTYDEKQAHHIAQEWLAAGS
jgi:hypothetical protein